MIIGVPKEIKEHEYRVGITPEGVKELKKDGHRVIIEKSAGAGSGFSDEEYIQCGAEVSDTNRLFNDSELIIKVKEPLLSEYGLLREGQSLFTFLTLPLTLNSSGFYLKKTLLRLLMKHLRQTEFCRS